MSRTAMGAAAARGGFANEDAICAKFNAWKDDNDAKAWLAIMGYVPEKIVAVTAYRIPTKITLSSIPASGIYVPGLKQLLEPSKFYEAVAAYKKADAQVNIVIQLDGIVCYENISLKKHGKVNYNQIDKRPVGTYQKMWGFNDNIAVWLKLMTGEITASSRLDLTGGLVLTNSKRVFLNEMPLQVLQEIIAFFDRNKVLVIADTLRGRGGLAAGWMLVTSKESSSAPLKYVLVDINKVMNYMAQGGVAMARRGSTLQIGRIVMQRKGGTPDPHSLQFKFHPRDLFDI